MKSCYIKSDPFKTVLCQDLNRVKNKPYTETVESNGRPDEVIKAGNQSKQEIEVRVKKK